MAHPPPPDDIARHTVRGSAYSVAASAVTIGLGVLRAYLMVLFLLPEEIGLGALAFLYVNFSTQVTGLGLESAFIHKPDAGPADRNTFFTFSFLASAAGLLAAALLAPAIGRVYPQYEGLQVLIWAAAGLTALRAFNQPQVRFLEKDLAFRRLAWLDVFGALANTVLGPGMAYLGFGVWAVMGEFAGGVLARTILVNAWAVGSRPRVQWDRGAARWLWEQSKPIWLGSNLAFLIDNFDDFWVGTALGKTPLGLYSKAYEFARYPRRVVANPILAVFFPTFAHLQGDRLRLSRAFFRSTSLIVRAGALFSLVVILAAPEAFRLFLPEAWAPMRLTFQLMIVYTFLDPLTTAAQRLLLATGRARVIARARWAQLAVFVPLVIGGAARFGIEGVAVAADLMILVGAVLLFRASREVVDYDARRLWLWPLAAMAAITAAVLLVAPAFARLPDLAALALKLALIPAAYAGVLWAFERDELRRGVNMIRGLLGKRNN